jgi:hypothetical protein
MARRGRKRLRRGERQRRDAERAAAERILLEHFPEARIARMSYGREGATLRIEGVERESFEELQQLLIDAGWGSASESVHLSPGTGKTQAVLARVNRLVMVEPWAMEMDERATARMNALGRVEAGFDFIELLVPKRVADEEIGDALELIARLMREGRPAWQIYLKALSAAFFVLLNGVREVTSSLLGKKNKA